MLFGLNEVIFFWLRFRRCRRHPIFITDRVTKFWRRFYLRAKSCKLSIAVFTSTTHWFYRVSPTIQVLGKDVFVIRHQLIMIPNPPTRLLGINFTWFWPRILANECNADDFVLPTCNQETLYELISHSQSKRKPCSLTTHRKETSRFIIRF